MNRRRFLTQTGAAGVSALRSLKSATQGVSIIVDRQSPITSAPPCVWAIDELRAALDKHGVAAKLYPRVQEAPAGDRHIVIAGGNSAYALEILRSANRSMPSSAEALCLVPGKLSGRSVLLAGGSDERGLVYAVLELADRVSYGSPLEIRASVIEKPANVVRSCARCFVSDVEDKSWYYDRALWPEYLTMLAANRFNRFNLTFGIGYNSNRDVPDSYLYFSYPFLLPVPGYNVTATGLADAERDRNLETLKFIAKETVA